jgi:F-type H+-transporting ATPase subunit b
MLHVQPTRSDRRACRTRAGARVWAAAIVLLAAAVLAPPAAAAVPQHEAATAAPQHEAGAAVPQHEAGAAAEAPHEQTLLQTVAKLANFAILAGVLVYFLRTPIAAYLSARATTIRSELVAASDLRAMATAQLAEIERKLQTLPAELEALKKQGAEDVVAEQARIAQAAAVERERLIQQTRREVETRLRVARRELTEHAAQLAVQVAEARIKRTITPEDQLRLVERYTTQLGEAR